VPDRGGLHLRPEPDEVPARRAAYLPVGGRLHQGRRQARAHRHGRSDPRSAQESRHRHVLRLRQRLRSPRAAVRPALAAGRGLLQPAAAVFRRHRASRAAAGLDARSGHRSAPVGHVRAANPAHADPDLAGELPPSRPAAAHQLLPEALAAVRRLSLLLAFLNMRRTLLIGGSLVVTLAIAAPLAFIWSVLYTNAGLQFAIRHIPHRFSGVQLDIIGARGTVAEGLSVERVEIDHDLVHLTFQRIEGRVALMPLMLQTIRVLHGSVGSALIAVKPRSRPPGPGGPVFLPPWMIISAEQGHVGSVTITGPNGFRLA